MVIFADDINVSPSMYAKDFFGKNPPPMLATNGVMSIALKVSKIFGPVYQGEGPFIGYPAIFVRLAGCNRGNKKMFCDFCDADFRFAKGQWMDYQFIVATVDSLATEQGFVKPMVVITGGEPMLQRVPLVNFCNLLLEKGYRVQIESNGDFSFDGLAGGEKGVFVVVSPKANPTKDGGTAYNIDWDNLRRADALKFLVNGDPNSAYYRLPLGTDNPKFNKLLDEGMVFVSPINYYKKVTANSDGERIKATSFWAEGDDQEIDFAATKASYARAALLVKHRGVRLTVQSHLFGGVE